MMTSAVSKTTQIWLLIAQIGILLPLYRQCSPWTLALLVLCLCWRTGIVFGRLNTPSRLLISVLGLLTTVSLTLFSINLDLSLLLTNLLVVAYGLKSLEVRRHADVAVLLLTGYFLIGLTASDQQPTSGAIYLALLVILNTTVMASRFGNVDWGASSHLAIRAIMFSLPLALLTFSLIPKSTSWLANNRVMATTGLSDSMSLGQISELVQSGKLAFRAKFDEQAPAMNERYWRALVLDRFDGTTWRSSKSAQRIGIADPVEDSGEINNALQQPQRYQLYFSNPPTKRWVPILDPSTTQETAVFFTRDGQLHWQRYAKESALTLYWQKEERNEPPIERLTSSQLAHYLALPDSGNPKTRAYAQTLRQQTISDEALIETLLSEFQHQGYRYTFKPPRLGKQQIDDFLFGTKAGFCGHYSSALTFIARAAGIPARMILGYQGGQASASGTVLSVHQYNAHAWVELWYQDRGWVRVDPTAYVAPHRIEQGSLNDHASQGLFARIEASLTQWGQVSTFKKLRSWLADLDHYWHQLRPSFQAPNWHELLKAIAAAFQPWQLVILALLTTTLVWRLRQVTPIAVNHDPVLAIYRKMEKSMRRHNLAPVKGESPACFASRIGRLRPDLATDLNEFVLRYTNIRYQPDHKQDLDSLQLALTKLKRAMAQQQEAVDKK